MKKFWQFKNKTEDSGELMLYGDISNSTWWGDEVTPKDFKKDLDALGDIKSLDIFINSGGGDVFAGQAIHSMLKRHEAYKTVYVDGLAASIASVIAMAGDKVIMPVNAMMMVHKAWTIAMGNSDDFRKLAEDMDKIDESIVATYQAKTGKDEAEINQLMQDETWMTAEEAVKNGFADEIEKEKKVAATLHGGFLMLNNQKFNLSRYKNAPQIEVAEPETVDIPDPNPTPNENRDNCQPVSDKQEQQDHFYQLRTKIYKTFEEEN